MGSSQSTLTGTENTGSFSIDPDGNISHKPSATNSGQPFTGQEDQHLVSSQNPSKELMHERDQHQLSQEVVHNVSDASTSKNKENELGLRETEDVLIKMKSKYKPTDLVNNMSNFQDIERNLIHCYATNQGQPLNCSHLSRQYKERVRAYRNKLLVKSKEIPLLATILVIIACVFLHMTTVSCYGAMSIDLGSEWMKVGLVAPSVPMDIVMNAQSQRKTPMAVAFANGDRFIGDAAIDLASKYPEKVYTHFLDLVGKTIHDESVKHYMKRFPYANITSHAPNSSSIVLNHPEGLSFTPLELIAMMIQHAHEQVTTRLGSNEPASDVVITVPPFFDSIERKVISQAAKLAGLNLLRLTDVNSAFALSYGIFRHKDYKPESDSPANRTSVLFFDQGASHTSATLADYHLIEQIDEVTGASKNDTLPTVTIRAQVYDRFLGGFDMQLRLRDHLVDTFSKITKIPKEKIYKRSKPLSKLLKEAAKIKRVLSANNDYRISVENVVADKDLKSAITRTEYEEMNQDLLEKRITDLLDRLFEMPGVSRGDPIESVVIVGGNTRTPKVQQVLLDYFKVDALGKLINADEGAALAALYQAASLGRGFRVKKFVLEQFGDPKRRFDPAKVITTTTTIPPPTSESADASTSQHKEDNQTTSDDNMTAAEGVVIEPISTTIEPTTTTTTPDPEIIYNEREINRIRNKLAHLKTMDELRLRQLSMRNSLETLISRTRDTLSSNEEQFKDKMDEIEKVLTETYEWIEDGPPGDRNDLAKLAEKYRLVSQLLETPQPETTPQLETTPHPETNSHPETNPQPETTLQSDTTPQPDAGSKPEIPPQPAHEEL